MSLGDIDEAYSMSPRHTNMLGAPPSVPAGAFFLPKIDLIFLNTQYNDYSGAWPAKASESDGRVVKN